MSVSAFMYGQALQQALGDGAGHSPNINLLGDTIKCLLCTSSYTPNQDTHVFKSDLTNEVAAGGGYSIGGVTLTTKTLTYNGSNNTITFDADDVSWAASTITARYAVVYDDTPGTDATKPLLFYVDFGGNVVSSSSLFTITWAGTGLFAITAA